MAGVAGPLLDTLFLGGNLDLLLDPLIAHFQAEQLEAELSGLVTRLAGGGP